MNLRFCSTGDSMIVYTTWQHVLKVRINDARLTHSTRPATLRSPEGVTKIAVSPKQAAYARA